MSCIMSATATSTLPIGSANRMAMYSGLREYRIAEQDDGQQRQHVPAHPALGGVDPELPPDREAGPDHAGEVVEDLGQVAADLALDQDGGHQDPDVHQVDPVGHGEQGVLERQAEALLLEDPAELPGHRLGASSATILNPEESGCPARIARPSRSMDSGSISSKAPAGGSSGRRTYMVGSSAPRIASGIATRNDRVRISARERRAPRHSPTDSDQQRRPRSS